MEEGGGRGEGARERMGEVMVGRGVWWWRRREVVFCEGGRMRSEELLGEGMRKQRRMSKPISCCQ